MRASPGARHHGAALNWSMALRIPLGIAAAALFPLGVAAAQVGLPQTRAERTAYRETSRYEDVNAFLAALARRDPRRVHLTHMGYTSEARPITLAVVGRVTDASPGAVRRSGRTVVYIQADIHAGEVEGKEAALMLLREIVQHRHDPWLDSLVLLVVPDYNADGGERVSLASRPFQNGPFGGAGQRENAQGLDLNRDHTKLESPEARSQAELWRRYDPQVAFDLHTTDGSVHAYMLTYAEMLHPATDPSLQHYVRDTWLPALTGAVRARYGFDLFFYGNTPDDPVERGGGGIENGWYTFDHRGRYSENYWGLRNRLGILLETYSYASFEDRVRTARATLVELLDFAWAHAGEIRALTAAADARSLVGDSLAVRAQLHRGDTITVLLGAVHETVHPYTGQRVLEREDVRRPVRMPDFTTFDGTEWARVPRSYLIPPGLGAVLDRLAAHGVAVRSLDAPRVVQLERFRVDSTWTRPRAYQGHSERTVRGAWESVTDTVPAGTVVVDLAQPLARLVVELLDPRSDDGFLDWNVLDDALAGARYYPIRRTWAPL